MEIFAFFFLYGLLKAESKRGRNSRVSSHRGLHHQDIWITPIEFATIGVAAEIKKSMRRCTTLQRLARPCT
jgi:hypothetical protein